MRITAATPLALGSASPRRRELLVMAGVPVVVRPASVDEAVRPGEDPRAYLERITTAKLDAVRESALDQEPAAGRLGVLVADTIVVSPGGAILGKPEDAARASGRTPPEETRAMIDLLAGASHDVSTRFILADGEPGAPALHAQTVTARVTFRAIAPDEAQAYAATGEGRDKAGGYAVQGRAASFIERIDGSYTSVVGLPLCEVVVAMRRLGWW